MKLGMSVIIIKLIIIFDIIFIGSSRFESEGGRVLDLGCGNGMSSISVAEVNGLIVRDVIIKACDWSVMLKNNIKTSVLFHYKGVSSGQCGCR